MPSSEFTPNSTWAQTTATGGHEELTTPSGQTCLAQKLSIEGMISQGILAEADGITAKVSKHVKKVKHGKAGGGAPTYTEEIDEKAILTDPKAMEALISMLDKAVPAIVVDPVVKIHYTKTTVGKTTVTKVIPIEDREPGVIYTDQVDFADKMFLFDWAAGGLTQMLGFRG